MSPISPHKQALKDRDIDMCMHCRKLSKLETVNVNIIKKYNN